MVYIELVERKILVLLGPEKKKTRGYQKENLVISQCDLETRGEYRLPRLPFREDKRRFAEDAFS